MIDEIRNDPLQEGSQKLPDTQPVDSQAYPYELSQTFTTFNNGWGTLFPINRSYHSFTVLTKESYSVGRSPYCSITIEDNGVMPTYVRNKMSKIHFKIWRDVAEDGSYVVYIEDLSSNGTYINGRKIGQNKRAILASSDLISLAFPSFEVFIFIDARRGDIDKWLSNDLALNYLVLKHLGTGGFGDVKLVINKTTFRKCAMKKIENYGDKGKLVHNEVSIVKRLKHPCVVKFETIYESSDAVYIAMEYIPGGNLMERINSKKKLLEKECKMIFFQLIVGVKYLHGEGIVHRDLKPENVLLEVKGEGLTVVKITDFGLSKILNSATNLKTPCGTLKYVAPEVLQSTSANYSHKVDIWSLGVILFFCLSGHHPFNTCVNQNELAAAIVRGDYIMNQNRWQLISIYAKHLVIQMLKVKPDERIDSSAVIRHQWFQDNSLKSRLQDLFRDEFLNCNELSGDLSDSNAYLEPKRLRMD